MELRDKLLQAVYDVIDEFNKELIPRKRLDKSPETILLGHGANLDSMEVFNFIIIFEAYLENAFKTNISLADEELWDHLENIYGFVEHVHSRIKKIELQEREL